MDELPPDPTPVPETPVALPPRDLSGMLGQAPTMAPPVVVPPPANVSHDPHQQLIALAALGFALGSGAHNGMGVGALEGVQQAHQALQAERDRQYQFQEQQAQQQNAAAKVDLNLKEKQYEDDHKYLQGALQKITDRVAKIPDKATYDTEIAGYAKSLQGAGFPRLTEDWLRQAAPYVAPKAKTAAATAVQGFLKNPANAELLKTHPDQLSNVVLTFDQDGDGIPEQVPLLRAAQIAGIPFGTDATGKPITYPKGTTLEDKASADAIFESLLQQAKTEGKDITNPDVRLALQKQALNIHRDASTRPPAAATSDAPSAVDDNAQQLFDGNLLPSDLSKRAATYNATLAKANRLSIEKTGHPLNLNKLKLDYEAAKKFTGTMNASQMVRFRGLAVSVVNTIDEVRRLGDALQQGSVRKWNQVRRNTMLQIYGNTPQSEQANQYLGAVNTLKEEFANLAQGGFAPTEDTWKLANQQIGEDFGFKDLNASLLEVQRLINYLVNAIGDQQPITAPAPGTGAVPPPTPASAAAPPPDAHPPIQKFGTTYTWDGSKYVKQ